MKIRLDLLGLVLRELDWVGSVVKHRQLDSLDQKAHFIKPSSLSISNNSNTNNINNKQLGNLELVKRQKCCLKWHERVSWSV